MKAIDFRNANFAALKAGIGESRARVLAAWAAYGPASTRSVAEQAHLDLLTLRPRTTELLQMGLLRLAEVQPHQGEGIYRARTAQEWAAWNDLQHLPRCDQLQLV